MTLSMTTVENSIYQALLLAGSNTRLIHFYPGAPRPELPYTSIQYLSNIGEINDWRVFDTTDEVSRYYGFREITYTINCYGPNAFDEANTLQGKLRTSLVREKLAELAGVTIYRMLGTRDLSSLIDSDFEKRVSFDVVFNVNLEDGSTTEDRGWFDTAGDIPWSNAIDLDD